MDNNRSTTSQATEMTLFLFGFLIKPYTVTTYIMNHSFKEKIYIVPWGCWRRFSGLTYMHGAAIYKEC
jgi:hypothetical protein